MKEFLKKLIAAKEKRAKELREQIKAAATADEVRALGDTLQAVLDELTEAREQLANVDDDNGQGNPGEEAARSANPMHEFRSVGQYGQPAANTGDRTDSVEYRTAFMNFVCRGVPIPAELRADAVTKTEDAGDAIPTVMVNEIVRELKSYGEIYARVRKLNVQGGVQIPTLSLKPTATWITADTGTSESDKQQLAAGHIIFAFYGLECKLSQTLLVNVTTLSAFQEMFVELATEAIVRAMEIAIFAGTGAGMPTGICKDTRVTNKVTMTAEEFSSWSAWKKKVFAKIGKAYRNGSFAMAQGTFDGYIDGMVDKNGQPIGRVNYGIDGGENYRFGGKEVLTVEPDVIADYDSASVGDVVAVFVNLSDYAINSNMEMRVVKWVDHDTNEVKNKTILICDGKLIDPHGVVLVVKG